MKKQIVYQGKVMEGYFIEQKNGRVRVFSDKKGKITNLSIPTAGDALYPNFNFSVKGKTHSVSIHRVIAEHLIPFPRPKNITERDWAATPETVKSIIKHAYRVNHIDHDKYNSDLSNLEWVTARENTQKSVQFYKRAAA
jgi:hypothetical protein